MAGGWLKKTVTCRQAANPVALLTSWCSTLSSKPEKGKSKLKSSIPVRSTQLGSSCIMWCRKKAA